MGAQLVVEAVWVHEVRAILRDADASAWRAERADELDSMKITLNWSL